MATATMDDILKLKAGAKITFKPGGRGSNEPIAGTFVRVDESFVVVKASAEGAKEKKVRPGQITIS